jgi:hypothetical protein
MVTGQAADVVHEGLGLRSNPVVQVEHEGLPRPRWYPVFTPLLYAIVVCGPKNGRFLAASGIHSFRGDQGYEP